MEFNPADYKLRHAKKREAHKIAAFYNGVIDHATQQPNRDIRWGRFSPQQVQGIIEGASRIEGEEILVVTERGLGRKAINAAVIVNELDREAWQDSDLPQRSLHFAKYAADPELEDFGRDVLWPHLKNYARSMGYQALHCEAFNFRHLSGDYLRNYYENTLGMTYDGPVVYWSSYYEMQIGVDPPVNRFYYPLSQDAVQS